MNQNLKQTRWRRWTNNIDSTQEALIKMVILVGLGILIGLGISKFLLT